MTAQERAEKVAWLFNHVGHRWLEVVPIDLRIAGTRGQEVIEIGDGVSVVRGPDQRWEVR